MRSHPLLALSLVLIPTIASAQTGADLAARQELVAQADQARTAGDHAHALDLALRAGRIRMTPSLGLMIAQEQRALGQLVDAYASALACARAAQADASAANRASIIETCTSVASALEPSLGRVRLRLPVALPPNARVRIANADVPADLRDVPRVVTPGEVLVEASAAGRTPFRRALRVSPGAVTDVSVELPSLLASPTPPPARSGPGTGPWVVAGVGAAGFVTAGVLYALAGAARDDRDAQCNAMGYCLPPSQDRDASYRDLLVGTNVALAAGGALVAGGALWYVIARVRGSRREAAPTAAVTPTAGGLAVGGTLRF